ncbi:MAG TPA: ABC transporter ATP-binding protein [Planctomycetota bacterium]
MARTPRIREAYRRLLPYLARRRRQAVLIVVLGAISAFGSRATLGLLAPLVNRLFPGLDETTAGVGGVHTMLGSVTENHLDPFLDGLNWFGMGPATSAVAFLTAVLLASSVLFAVLQYFFLRLSRMLGVWMITDLRQDLAEHVLRLGMRYHSGRRLGDLLSRLTADTGTSLRILNLIVEEIIQEPFAIIASLSIAYAAAPMATLGMILFVPVLTLPVIKFGPAVRRRSAKSLKMLGDSTQSLTQMFAGIRVVKAFRMEEREGQEFRAANAEFVRQTDKMVKAQSASLALTAFLSTGGVGLVIGAIALVNLKIAPVFKDPGHMAAFFAAIGLMYTSVKRLTKAMSVIYTSVGATERVFEVFDLRPEIEESPYAQPFVSLRDQIVFDDVHFDYGTGDAPALRGVNFTVRRGERIALVGPSGAGKSTLLDLVARFYDPTQGRIVVDGVDLRELRIADWLDSLAVVSQNPFLFQTTIGENVRYGRPAATPDEVREACEAAHLNDFVDTLPQGAETEVGDAGARLSGGQAQRVTIARAILKNAQVLLLDEATSALDSESERRVQDALENLMRDRTSFVIAHRLSTIRAADRILVLDKGQIVEDGRHDELLAHDGLYARMWKLQANSSVLQDPPPGV